MAAAADRSCRSASPPLPLPLPLPLPPPPLLLLLLLLACLPIRDVAAYDAPIECSSNPCQSGGTCYVFSTSMVPDAVVSHAPGATLELEPERDVSSAEGTLELEPERDVPSANVTLPAARCPPPFLPAGGRCLWLTTELSRAAEGGRQCRHLAGRLAAVDGADAPLLRRLLRSLPVERHVWVAGGGAADRRRRCMAVQADSGRRVLRRCAERLRSLCQRQPLLFARNRRPARGAPRRRLDLQWEQACHCPEGYGMDDCQKVNGESGHESNPCDGAMIGDGSTQLIIDFAFFGRMHYDPTVPGCYQPDVPLPEDSAGCMAPVSETVLRYWCQGKYSCRPQSTVIVNYSSNSCEDVTGMLHLRTRKVPPGNVSSCALGSHYYEPHRTCYQVTDQADDWEDQLLLCRRLGGDLAFVPAGNQTDFLAFLSRLSSGQPLWVAGNASEARPVVDLRRAWYLSGVDSCVGGGDPVHTCEQALLRAACALPPWPAAAVPIPVQCPPASFPDLVGGVTFGSIEAGHTAAVPCGAGYSGDATYTCDVDGQWSAAYPDLTACTSDGIDTDAVAAALRDGDQPVSDVVAQLATNCSAARQLSAGDVVGSAQLLPLMVATQTLQLETLPDKAHVAEMYLSNFTRLVSILTATDSSWLTMSLLKKRSSSSLIQHNVEQSAYLLAGLLHNVSKVFDKYQQQIRLQVGRFAAEPLLQHLQYNTSGGSVTLPGEVAQFADDDGSTSVVFVEYVTMDCLLGSRPCRAFHDSDEPYKGFINSPLLSASVANTSVQLLNSNVTLVFNRRLVNSSAAKYDTSNTQCVFWDNDPDVEYWSSDGCYVIATTEDTVVCSCSHLTSFATLLDFNGVVSPELDAALDWITNIGCGISLACLAVCVLVFTAIPALRSDRTSVHRNLCLCLFIAELIMLAGLTPHGNAVGCAIVAGLLHYFFLAVFAWMCIEGVQIYLLLYKVFDSGRSYMRYFYVFGYGIPAVIVGISVAVDRDGYGETGPRGISSGACWLNSANLIWAFAGPALVVILVNILALILALRVTQRARAARSDKSSGQAATWLKGSASLVVILGTTWLFGFMYFSKGTVFIAVIFTILNSLQGVFIFLFHVILNDKTKREATRFMRKTTVRMGLTSERSATTTPGSGGRPPHTTVTRLGATSSSPLASTSADDAGQSQTKLLGHLQQLARRMGNAHYSVKRVDGKSMSSDGTSSHETLRKVSSSAADNHATA